MENRHEKINQLVDRIMRHQAALGMSDAKFITRYERYLGSAKTYRDRLCKRAFSELGGKLVNWERKLEAMVAEIDGRSPLDKFFEQMPFAQKLTEIYNTLQGQRSDRRCGVCLATTGCGKSQWARWIKNQNPRETVYVRANESWRDSQFQIVMGIAKEINCPVEGNVVVPAVVMNKVIDFLKLNPLTVIIDEAHEGGVLLMKLVKTLIDETSSRFILLAFPTIWTKVMSASDGARAEAQQLFGRTLKPVFSDYATGLKKEDVAVYLRMAAELEDDAESTATRILPLVKANGNLRLLADAIDNAQMESDVTDKPITGTMVYAQVMALCPAVKEGK